MRWIQNNSWFGNVEETERKWLSELKERPSGLQQECKNVVRATSKLSVLSETIVIRMNNSVPEPSFRLVGSILILTDRKSGNFDLIKKTIRKAHFWACEKQRLTIFSSRTTAQNRSRCMQATEEKTPWNEHLWGKIRMTKQLQTDNATSNWHYSVRKFVPVDKLDRDSAALGSGSFCHHSSLLAPTADLVQIPWCFVLFCCVAKFSEARDKSSWSNGLQLSAFTLCPRFERLIVFHV